jgi:hypothetical protein
MHPRLLALDLYNKCRRHQRVVNGPRQKIFASLVNRRAGATRFLSRKSGPIIRGRTCVALVLSFLVGSIGADRLSAAELRVGAAAVDLRAGDSMVIAGGIGPGRAKRQEGRLRAVAVVIGKEPLGKLEVVARGVLFVPRGMVDPANAAIEKSTGNSATNVLVNAAHTHHAPQCHRVARLRSQEKAWGRFHVDGRRRANLPRWRGDGCNNRSQQAGS